MQVPSDGWRVDYRGGPFDGPIDARQDGTDLEVVAYVTALGALSSGIGSAGHLIGGGIVDRDYLYKVASIDHENKLVVVQLESLVEERGESISPPGPV